jgi:hypothetical protein
LAIEFNWDQSGVLSSGTSVSVNAGTQVINLNDLLIACVVPQSGIGSSDPGTISAPAGWVQLDNTQLQINGDLPATTAIFYKIADGAENSNPSDLTFTWSNDAACSWTLLDYSGVDINNPIDASGGETNTSGYSADTTAPSVLTQHAGDTLVNIWISKGGSEAYANDQSTNLLGDTNSNSSTIPEIMVADKTLTSAGQTSADVMTEKYTTIDQRGFSIALNSAVSCFMPGTIIRTLGGERAVEAIVRGECVMTTDGRAKKVSWIGRQTVLRRFADPLRVLPIRIKAGALAENVPSRDLLLSPDHAILVQDVLIQAGALVNGTSIIRETRVPQTFTYYHVELEDHSLIFAENTPAETFIDNVERLAFDNWQEHETLFPEKKPIVEMQYPRAKAHRQVPRLIREQLAERSAIVMTQAQETAA